MFTIDDDPDDEQPPITELNALEQPGGVWQWDRGCLALATQNECRYGPVTAESLIHGVAANYCEPHARAR
jgi:hypothetical protein